VDLLPVVVLGAAALAGLLVGVAIDRGRRARPAPPSAGGSASGSPEDADLVADRVDVPRRGRRVPPDPAPAEPLDPDVDGLLAGVGVGILRVSPDLNVRSASPAAHALLDRQPGSMAGRGVLEAITDQRAEQLVRRALHAGSAAGELAARDRDARTVVLRARRAADGDVWVVLEDVTELRRLQRIRVEFVDNLSHELRTPLTTISLLAETLSREADSLPPKAAERAGKIEVETGHLVQMVNELLDLARIESGTRLLVLDEIDVVALAGATIERIALFSERQGILLRLATEDGVPHVRGDAARLGQALLNLVHNAVKFSSPGQEVTVRVASGPREVVVAVIDHGIGIPSRALPRIFERFYKVDRARVRQSGGTGLGLSIARHIVEAHGGRIWAESEEGVGSTFSFAIPVGGPSEGTSRGEDAELEADEIRSDGDKTPGIDPGGMA
jgi:two-component system phosphate regulon sensor histidine kinase PhoR